MSGFEIAGIVLGSIPLLISGLEHYRNGLETIGSMVQYVEVVNNILVSVSTDLAIYRQSCEAVLRRLILPENILDELLHKRSSRAWEDEGLAVQIKKQFGSSSEYNTYLQAVVRLNKRIDKLRSKLELDENFQVSSHHCVLCKAVDLYINLFPSPCGWMTEVSIANASPSSSVQAERFVERSKLASTKANTPSWPRTLRVTWIE